MSNRDYAETQQRQLKDQSYGRWSWKYPFRAFSMYSHSLQVIAPSIPVSDQCTKPQFWTKEFWELWGNVSFTLTSNQWSCSLEVLVVMPVKSPESVPPDYLHLPLKAWMLSLSQTQEKQVTQGHGEGRFLHISQPQGFILLLSTSKFYKTIWAITTAYLCI